MNRDLIFMEMICLSRYYMISIASLVPLRVYTSFIDTMIYPSDLIALLILKYIVYVSKDNKMDYFNAMNVYYIYMMVLMYVVRFILIFHRKVTLKLLEKYNDLKNNFKLSYWARYTKKLGYTQEEAVKVLSKHLSSERYRCVLYPSYRIIKFGDWLISLSDRMINFINKKRLVLNRYVETAYNEI